MVDNEILKFQIEIGKIKRDLLLGGSQSGLEDEESYRLATKIDITVSRLIRLIESKHENAE